METTNDNLSQNDISLLNRFKTKATEFVASYNRLVAINDIPPNLQGEYSDLRSRSDGIQGTIGWVTETIDSVTGYFSDFFGLNGTETVKDFINNKNESLGLIPVLLPVAAITAAIGVMSKYISDVYVFERKVTEQRRLEKSGISPEAAAKIVNEITNDGLTKNLTKLAKPIAYSIGIYYLYKFVTR